MPLHAVAIVLGSLLAYYGNELPDPAWTAFAPILLWLVFFNPRYRFLLLVVAAYLWSGAWFHYHLGYRLADIYENRVNLVRGDVTGMPEQIGGRVRFSLENIDIDGSVDQVPRLIRLSWYQDRIIPRPGERWQFEARLRQPRGLLNPGTFDYEAWQFVRGIDATGYVRNSPLNERLRAPGLFHMDLWRQRLAEAIDRHCEDCRQQGLIKALTLGFRGDIREQHRRLLQSSGTAHLLAISGLHIGMVALMVFALGRYCWRFGIYRTGIDRTRTSAVLALLAATAYAALAGFSLPTVRALAMLVILLLALLLRQRINLLQSLCLAIVAMLLVDPRAIGSNSFWLSAGALLVIAFAGFRLPGGMRWWQQLLALQAFFSLLFAPAGLLVFEQVNPATFVANIVAIPVISFIVLPVLLLGCALLAARVDSANLLFVAADRVLQLLLGYLETLVESGFGPVHTAYPAPLLLLALGILVWLMLPRMPYLRGVAVLGLALLVYWQPPRPPHGGYELLVLDVGMGTSILIRTRNHSLVYDFGPGIPGVFSASERALLPMLERLALDAPDLAVVSHVDQDHSGGLPAYLERYPRSRLLSGTPRKLVSKFSLPWPVRSCHGYPGWRWDGVEFRFLSLEITTTSSNNRSCVLLVEGFHRVLIPGDIEFARERSLVARYGGDIAADVMIAPHHGSETSSSDLFVSRVGASHVVFTMSHGNRWGFPARSVVARYEAHGARLYRNDRDGAIGIASGAQGLDIERQRLPPRRIWRRW